MSYDIRFHVDGATVEFNEAVDIKGGTYCVGGTPEAWLNITYNYGRFFRDQFGDDGIRALYGLHANQAIPLLETAVKALGTKRAPDYWAATAGNAGAALNDLLTLARMCPPHAVMAGD